MSVKITNVKYKKLNVNDIVDMLRIATINARYLAATANSLSAMVHGLTAKKDEPLRHMYERKVKMAVAKQQQEEAYMAIYTETLKKHHVNV